MTRFQFVADHQARYGVKRLCRILNIARSSFYYWKSTAADRAARDAADAALAVRIRVVQARHDGTYGAPRVTAELRDGGQRINHKKVARVMRRHHLRGLRLRRRVQTTVADPAAVKAPDLIGRDFTAPGVNQRYVGDITYLPVGERGFLYLATVIDLHSRRLAGWAIADHMRTELVIDALRAAERTRGSLAGAIFHSDHGSVDTSRDYTRLCVDLGIGQSMGAVGSSVDNALAESFNAALKREVLQDAACWADEPTCRRQVFKWLTRYNTKRRHSWCRYQSPIAYETSSTATLQPAA